MEGPIKSVAYIPVPNRNVIVQDVFGELLVYDLQRNIVRRLNRIAAAVWKECDGQKSVEEIARAVAPHFELPVDEQVILLALDRFRGAHLLAGTRKNEPRAAQVSRRELIKRIGVAALPLVTSMAVPAAAQAASCFVAGHACSSNNQCCSGLCLPGILGLGVCT